MVRGRKISGALAEIRSLATLRLLVLPTLSGVDIIGVT